MKEFVHCRRNV